MAGPTVLAEGFQFPESPRWHGGRWWVSDWGAHQVVSLDAGGGAEVALCLPSFPLCFDFLPDGRLLAVFSQESRLVRLERDGRTVTHADLSTAATTPWNDIVVDGRGNVYVNTIGFEFPGGDFAPGSVVLVRPDGRVARVAGDLAFPNGMAVTPDNRTLVVAESYAGQLTAFDIAEDGTLSGRRAWADVGDAAPDGICLDAEGCAWFADVPHQRCVRVREGGEVLAAVDLDRGAFACMLGGADGRTLLVVTNRWEGPSSAAARQGTCQALTVTAPAAAAGWPG
jgi:sugar lactone lactonase YvrE